MSTPTELYLASTKDVICDKHTIAIRYHLFQDDHKDEPLSIGTRCYIILKDRRHPTYLVCAVITNVDCTKHEYTVQRVNDNEIETYPWHQIVIAYNKQNHCVDIEQHKEKILRLRNPPTDTEPVPSPTPPGATANHKRKRKRDATEIETSEFEPQPNKKRKLNNNNHVRMHSPAEKDRSREIHTVAQPYFPIPHPYFRQNALLKWKPNGKTESNSHSNDWDVGRIVDFSMECDTVYIQNTYRCGTKDDELRDVRKVSDWYSFVEESEAQFIDDLYLYRLYSSILYWWDRPGCGCVCEDTIEGLDYGAHNDLIYGITGGRGKNRKTKQKRSRANNRRKLVWCHQDGIFEASVANKVAMSKYIAKNKNKMRVKKRKTTNYFNKIAPSRVLDVLIIGAGMAGVTARWALNECGADPQYKVKLLEAQDYIGGRLKAYSFPSKLVCDPFTLQRYHLPSVSVELGAAFLSGSGKDNRFWSWLERKGRAVCTDWGGYNNGWWNGDSFIDSHCGEFVNNGVIERIKTICDDIQTLCCKLLMPLRDMSVVDALEYLKCRIPHNQLFGTNDNEESKRYFYAIYDKYKILSANWVGPQGLWQQQQTVELQNLDFEALYVFLQKVFAKTTKKGKKWLRATERLIEDYYGDNTNIKTENMNLNRFMMQQNISTISDAKAEEDSEATESEEESESNSVTLSPLPPPPHQQPLIPLHVDWSEIVRYDVSHYGDCVPFHYKFGYKDILVRDIIAPPLGEEEAGELERSTGLSPTDYQRFRSALQHLADCNLFSYHLYFLRSELDAKWRDNAKVKHLLHRFKDDLDSFDLIIADFQNILQKGKKNSNDEDESYRNGHDGGAYHTNRKAPPPTRQNAVIAHHENNGHIDMKDDAINNTAVTGEEETGANAFKQSVFDSSLTLNACAPQVGDGFVVNGYSQVLDAFVDDNNRENIHLNHRVTCIERHGTISEIRGIDLASGKPFCFYSRFVICSVPLGVLKLSIGNSESRSNEGGMASDEFADGIQFKPPLSAAKQAAIGSMGMGVENKVYLRFTQCFWPRDKPYFQSIQHPEYRFINLSYGAFKLPQNTNVLCSMIPPNVAKKWHKSNPAQELRIIWDVLRVLNEMFKQRRNAMDNNEKRKEEIVSSTDADTGIKHQYSDYSAAVDSVDNKMDDVTCTNTTTQEETQRLCTLNHDESISALLALLVDYKVTDWKHNLFTRGSYSYLPKGAIYTNCKSLQKYDGNGVYFCGEATSVEGFECVDGAHETGFSAAKQIHKQLQQMKKSK